MGGSFEKIEAAVFSDKNRNLKTSMEKMIGVFGKAFEGIAVIFDYIYK